jgi:segregation and condensation protein B
MAQAQLPDIRSSSNQDDEFADGVVSPAGAAPASTDSGVELPKAEQADDGELDPLEVEAFLFSARHPLTTARLVELTDRSSAKSVRQAVATLNQTYEQTGRAFRIEQVAGGYQMLTLPQFGDHLKRLHQNEADAKLTKAALETLAIIAYKQPILRADLEAIRGVASGETIRSLMEKHLVKIAGRAELPGRPILYGTTKRFLELFGLNTLKDLPLSENGVAPLRPAPTPKADSASVDKN